MQPSEIKRVFDGRIIAVLRRRGIAHLGIDVARAEQLVADRLLQQLHVVGEI